MSVLWSSSVKGRGGGGGGEGRGEGEGEGKGVRKGGLFALPLPLLPPVVAPERQLY